ncbi:MAG: tyrosine-type recombinase/integrase [Salinibacter sp.]
MSLLSRYLETISSDQTCRAYDADLQRFFGKRDLDESDVERIDPDAIQSVIRSMSRDGKALSTQQRRLSALRGFFDWLIQNGFVSRNPARHPQVEPLRPKAEMSSSATLSKANVEKMIEVAGESARSGLRDQALILTIVYGALRRREIASLEVDHVRPLGGYWILDLDPIAKSSGYVRIPETVVEAIERVKDRYGITKGRLWRSVSNQNRGAPMTADAVYKVVRCVSHQAGLKPVSIDTLRQAGLQIALEGGASVPQVQAHGRLADSATAARLYDSEHSSGTLSDSPVECIDLDAEKIPSGGQY